MENVTKIYTTYTKYIKIQIVDITNNETGNSGQNLLHKDMLDAVINIITGESQTFWKQQERFLQQECQEQKAYIFLETVL